MRTVWKYEMVLVSGELRKTFDVPINAYLRHVGVQGTRVCLWFEVESERETAPITFQVVGTGHPLPPDGSWRGTCQMGDFVWHVFEVAV